MLERTLCEANIRALLACLECTRGFPRELASSVHAAHLQQEKPTQDPADSRLACPKFSDGARSLRFHSGLFFCGRPDCWRFLPSTGPNSASPQLLLLGSRFVPQREPHGICLVMRNFPVLDTNSQPARSPPCPLGFPSSSPNTVSRSFSRM